jgi:chlorophyllide a reductase subunit Y
MSKTIPIVAANSASATAPTAPGVSSTTLEGDGMGCHAGGDQLLAAAKSAGKSEVLAQYAKDYPKDP